MFPPLLLLLEHYLSWYISVLCIFLFLFPLLFLPGLGMYYHNYWVVLVSTLLLDFFFFLNSFFTANSISRSNIKLGRLVAIGFRVYFKWNKVEWKGVFQNGILLFFFFALFHQNQVLSSILP